MNFKFTILLVIFILGLVYILIPGPSSINDFSALPNSTKSTEPGDTYQNPNIAAYFSDFDRVGITNFYINDFKSLYLFGFLIPPLRLNYPPEDANTFVKDQISTTFLEEYIYPLKGSIFVAGWEPVIYNNIKNRPHTFVGDHIQLFGAGRYYNSKTTLRFYPAPLWARVIVYLGIWGSILGLWFLSKKVFNWRKK